MRVSEACPTIFSAHDGADVAGCRAEESNRETEFDEDEKAKEGKGWLTRNQNLHPLLVGRSVAV
jgi:hypothetical protein